VGFSFTRIALAVPTVGLVFREGSCVIEDVILEAIEEGVTWQLTEGSTVRAALKCTEPGELEEQLTERLTIVQQAFGFRIPALRF
jgi:hypothetical protein